LFLPALCHIKFFQQSSTKLVPFTKLEYQLIPISTNLGHQTHKSRLRGILCERDGRSDVFVLRSKGKNREPGSRKISVRKFIRDHKNDQLAKLTKQPSYAIVLLERLSVMRKACS